MSNLWPASERGGSKWSFFLLPLTYTAPAMWSFRDLTSKWQDFSRSHSCHSHSHTCSPTFPLVTPPLRYTKGILKQQKMRTIIMMFQISSLLLFFCIVSMFLIFYLLFSKKKNRKRKSWVEKVYLKSIAVERQGERKKAFHFISPATPNIHNSCPRPAWIQEPRTQSGCPRWEADIKTFRHFRRQLDWKQRKDSVQCTLIRDADNVRGDLVSSTTKLTLHS